jgi:multidrug resistance protein, MATE family
MSQNKYPVSFGESTRSVISRSWSVSWPMTLIMVFEFLIGLADVYVAGKMGKEVQATYGFVIQFYFIMIIIANAMTVGTVSVVSRLFTSGSSGERGDAVFSSLVVAVIAGLALAIGGIVFGPGIIALLNIPEAVKVHAIPFIRFYAGGLFFHYLLINSNGILRSCQKVKTSLATMAVVAFANISLSLFLSFHTSLGYRGIAAATASSVFLGCIINLMHVKSLMPEGKRFSKTIVRKMFDIGWPIGLLQALWQAGSMTIFLILSQLPEHRIEILAALTAGLRVESAIYLPVFGFNMANAVIIGNLLGEGRRDEAFRSGIVTAAIGVGIVAAMVVLVVVNASWIVSYLTDHDLVMRESVRYIYISMISEPFMAWGIILGGGLNGAGDTKRVLLSIASTIWLIRIPLSYLSVVHFQFGPASVWWIMNLSQFVQAVLISKRYFGRKWLTEAPVFQR